TVLASPRRSCSRRWPPRVRPSTAASPRRRRQRLDEVSCAGLTRASIFFERMDCRIKSGNDADFWLSAVASRRLDQSLGDHGLLHRRPFADAVEIGLQVRMLAEVELQPNRPTQHREQVAVGDRELLAHQVVLAGKLAVDMAERLAELVAED